MKKRTKNAIIYGEPLDFSEYAKEMKTDKTVEDKVSEIIKEEILKELKNEHKEIFDRVNMPPILTGKIDGWIGYGSEPTVLLDGENTSFNEIRSIAINNGIKIALNEWLYKNENRYRGGESGASQVVRNLWLCSCGNPKV